MNKELTLILIVLSLLFACGNNSMLENNKSRPRIQDLEGLNRYMVEKDRERIESYIERKGLKMEENPLGLWYGSIVEGEGDTIKSNDRVTFEYVCALLDGTVCYTSEELGKKEVIVGKGDIEAGLDAGLRLMKGGGEANFILPSYLAFGLKGDGKRIPSRSVVVYWIKIVSIN
jgi:FKBP-type peptidyl-prolyl cis-trans isomerase FkpA